MGEEVKLWKVSDEFGNMCYELAEEYRKGITTDFSVEHVDKLIEKASFVSMKIEDSCRHIDMLSDGDRELEQALNNMLSDLCEIKYRLKRFTDCYYDHWEHLKNIGESKCIYKDSVKKHWE